MKISKKRLKEIIKEEFQNEDWKTEYQGYSSKEAKNVVDGALRHYSKDLKKLQYRVIKDWMSKAKNGIIDYFDLVRGLETGDIARAHPYETKFFKGLLDRDKITNRFRKYL